MSLLDRLRLEARGLRMALQTGAVLRRLPLDGAASVADLVERQARSAPSAPAIRFEGRTVTYGELDAAASRVAHWARSQGVARGDVVALFLENRPEYLFLWIGLAKLGAVAALVNTNLRAGPLAHSLRVAGATLHVVGAELSGAYAEARAALEEKPPVWVTGGSLSGADDLDVALEAQPETPVGPEARAGLRTRDLLFYVYTSGTTGLPKAARISHHRFLTAAHAFRIGSELTERDRVYVVLPLYHTAGGICAVGMAAAAGATIVLRRRFSARQFWEDCVAEGVTVFQYIGELCRYLLNTPPHPDEQRHRVRLCVGNGLRPDVWEAFRERFRIPRILEFYGSTEGNVALTNLDGRPGAIGRVPWYLERFFTARLIRFDVAAEAPVRGPGGFCVACAPGEIGELVGKIPQDPKAALGRFEGYTEEGASEKKILRDVFEKGDAWFRTGDLLRRDAAGYYYFVDRIGDTFRWKGENVATSEVAEVLSTHPGVSEANVYGVRVPGTDGRAGMAALVVEGGLSLESLYAHVERQLPAYARPLFLRLRTEMEVTGTFKHRKVELVAEGFDPSTIAEPLFFADAEKRSFVPLDAALYERIQAGEIRL
ncbi:MAG TPA: long-chain-acyl-CoA synthetase [Myxococcota bacterium]|jgi:fatty-acyl-CoA synthase|nr:long-chain-acyl-CoA synthetase [Myxococcota bacterium]